MAEHTKSNTAVADKPTATGGKNIIDTASADGRFKTLATALTTAGLVETLQGAGPFTVFAPTDQAFAALPKGTLDSLLKDKSGLSRLLQYHVLPGRMLAADLTKQADEDGTVSSKTADGRSLSVHIDGSKVFVGTGDTVQVTKADIMASNGVIHVIDGVLTPPK